MVEFTQAQAKELNKVEKKIGDKLYGIATKAGIDIDHTLSKMVSDENEVNKLLSQYETIVQNGEKLDASKITEVLKARLELVNEYAKKNGGFKIVDDSVYNSEITKYVTKIVEKDSKNGYVTIEGKKVKDLNAQVALEKEFKETFLNELKFVDLGLTKAKAFKEAGSKIHIKDVVSKALATLVADGKVELEEEKVDTKKDIVDVKGFKLPFEEIIINGLNINHLLESLITRDVVTVKFTKLDGSERTLVGTRKPMAPGVPTENEDDLVQVNNIEEIKKQLGKQTIPLYDIQNEGFRKFNLYRLKEYVVDGKTYTATVNNGDSSKHFNPQTLTAQEIVDVLTNKVVRVVFQKADKSKRVMIATRNAEIVDLYTHRNLEKVMVNNTKPKTDAEIAEQKAKELGSGLIKCFDVVNQQWRSFKMATLEPYDDAVDIASWIEYDIKDDGWYNIAYEGGLAKRLYEDGKRDAIKIGSGSKSRAKFEAELAEMQKAYQEKLDEINKRIADREKGGETEREKALARMQQSVGQFNVRFNVAYGLAKLGYEVVHNNGEPTDKDIKLYEKFKTAIKEFHAQSVKAGQPVFLNIEELRGINGLEFVATYKNGEKFIVTPRYVINGSSFKVYADLTDKIHLGQGMVLTSSEADKEVGGFFEKLATEVNNRRRVREVQVSFKVTKAKYKDVKRTENLANNLKAYKDHVASTKDKKAVKLGQHKLVKEGDEIYVLLQTTNDTYKISPAGIVGKENGVVYKRERHTASTSELVDFIRNNLSLSTEKIQDATGLTKDEFNTITGIMSKSFDLRNGGVE